jgi:flagella basal body P-ring formation protein FlgA
MRAIAAITGLLLVAPASVAAAQDAVRAAIVTAVSEQLGAVRTVDVEIVSGLRTTTGTIAARPYPGARLGQQIRFLITPSTGSAFQVVARVSVVAEHAVAVRDLARGDELTAADVDWKTGTIDGQLLKPLPTHADVLGAVARRALVAGEVLTSTVLAQPLAVRAGDAVTVTFRSGRLEARSVGRAVSSGGIGDVIRITAPGSRDIRRGRITAPDAVEIVR